MLRESGALSVRIDGVTIEYERAYVSPAQAEEDASAAEKRRKAEAEDDLFRSAG